MVLHLCMLTPLKGAGPMVTMLWHDRYHRGKSHSVVRCTVAYRFAWEYDNLCSLHFTAMRVLPCCGCKCRRQQPVQSLDGHAGTAEGHIQLSGPVRRTWCVIICTAMKRYGLILADVGTSWYLTGGASVAWEEPDLLGAMDSSRREVVMSDLEKLRGDQMEVLVVGGKVLRGSRQPET